MIVWLASYPRSGNTFFRVILNSVFNIKTYSIYDDKFDIAADKDTSDIVGHKLLPLDFNLEKAREDEKIFYIKTHELSDERVKENDKIIYLIRDGRECSLSFTRHQNMFLNSNASFLDTIYGNNFVGTWGNHVSSWSKNKNIILIKFEELVKNPMNFIDQISNFLDKKYITKNIPTFQELKIINPKFFRSGQTNSWETIFTEEEHVAFWLKNYIEMIKYGYKEKMPLAFKEESKISVLKELSNQNFYIMDILVKEKNKQLRDKDKDLNEKEEVIQSLVKELKIRELQLKEKEILINELVLKDNREYDKNK